MGFATANYEVSNLVLDCRRVTGVPRCFFLVWTTILFCRQAKACRLLMITILKITASGGKSMPKSGKNPLPCPKLAKAETSLTRFLSSTFQTNWWASVLFNLMTRVLLWFASSIFLLESYTADIEGIATKLASFWRHHNESSVSHCFMARCRKKIENRFHRYLICLTQNQKSIF